MALGAAGRSTATFWPALSGPRACTAAHPLSVFDGPPPTVRLDVPAFAQSTTPGAGGARPRGRRRRGRPPLADRGERSEGRAQQPRQAAPARPAQTPPASAVEHLRALQGSPIAAAVTERPGPAATGPRCAMSRRGCARPDSGSAARRCGSRSSRSGGVPRSGGWARRHRHRHAGLLARRRRPRPAAGGRSGRNAGDDGCRAADFAGVRRGDVVLVERGTCRLRSKVDDAARAGAVGRRDLQRRPPGRRGTIPGSLVGPGRAHPGGIRRLCRRSPAGARRRPPRQRARACRVGAPHHPQRDRRCRPAPAVATWSWPARTSIPSPKARGSTTTPAAWRRCWSRPSRWPVPAGNAGCGSPSGAPRRLACSAPAAMSGGCPAAERGRIRGT